jgi:DNA helicase-2/ATP-dependent DNA helicase PcrA
MPELDSEQRRAVEAPERAIAVLAGPGSGKTLTLGERTKYLLGAVAGQRALLLTFMNKAAAEMKARVLSGSSLTVEQVDAGTFHSFGMRFLRSHGPLVGIDSDFDVLDPDDAGEIAALAGGDADLLRRWVESRQRSVPADERTEAFGARFQQAKREEGLVDFDDLVILTAAALEANSEVAAAYGLRYPHLLVDEFQDTNPAQFRIVRALAPGLTSISVFADDDQAIMRFAGADAANIGRFIAELSATEYPLTVNYRCRARIVECANALLAADTSTSTRRMRADRPGGEVLSKRFTDEAAEATWIAEDVDRLLSDRSSAEIAVLSPMAARADRVMEKLVGRGFPVSDWRGEVHSSDGRRILRATLALLRPRLTGRHERLLCEIIGVAPTHTGGSVEFLEQHASHPMVSGLSVIRASAMIAARPGELVAAIQQVVAREDASRAQGMTTIVSAIRAFEERDATFTVEHLLSAPVRN